MKYEHSHWGWMLAADFYLGGIGGGMLSILAVQDLFLGSAPTYFLLPLLAAAGPALGSALLILELGRPLQAWRVFLNPRAILAVGAWLMLLSIAFGVILSSFGIAVLPWSQWVPVRHLVAFVCLALGLGISTYTGLLLGKMQGRSFWSGPGLALLFLLSAISTSAAAYGLFAAALGDPISRQAPLVMSNAMFLALQLIFWMLYVGVKATSGGVDEVRAALRWTRGDRALAFWAGVIGLGLTVPIVFFIFGSDLMVVLGNLAVLVGGLLMRLMVVAADERIWLPGEQAFAATLPDSREAFLHAWK